MLMENMDMNAGDNGWYGEYEPIFELKSSSKEAEEELQKLLSAWANKHIKATQCTIKNPEEIQVFRIGNTWDDHYMLREDNSILGLNVEVFETDPYNRII